MNKFIRHKHARIRGLLAVSVVPQLELLGYEIKCTPRNQSSGLNAQCNLMIKVITHLNNKYAQIKDNDLEHLLMEAQYLRRQYGDHFYSNVDRQSVKLFDKRRRALVEKLKDKIPKTLYLSKIQTTYTFTLRE